MEFLLELKDWFLNMITLGWWGKSQGDKSSGAYIGPHTHASVDFKPKGPRFPKGEGKHYD